MRKLMKNAAMLIIALAIAVGQVAQPDVHAEADEGIRIDMRVGYDKFYKIGYVTPFYFEVENQLRDINGELQIEMPEQSDSITLYAMNVSLPKGSVKKFVMNVPVNVFNTKINVNITEGKNIVAAKSFRVDPGVSSDTFVVGILSDDFESVRYINKITINNAGNFSTRNVRLDEGSFPEDVEALNAFNVIVVNNYDTSKLSSVQYQALKKWVYDGGVLVIGTGPSYNKTLSAFRDDFITGEVGGLSTLTTSSLHKTAESKAAENMDIGILDISIKESIPVIRDGEYILMQKTEKGKGVIAVASFDFGMEPLPSWAGNSTFADKAITAVLPGMYLGEMYQKGIMMRDNTYAIENALRNIPELPLPKTSHMVFIYIAYILLCAPVSYFILKRADKRELMWLTVPVFSVIFSGIVYASGIGTRLTEPITNFINLAEIDDSGSIKLKTYAGVFTPGKETLKIEAGEDFSIRPLRNSGMNYRATAADNDSAKRVDAKIVLSPRTTLEFYRNEIWSMRTMALETDEFVAGRLESSFNYAKETFTGTIKNDTGFDLDECYIITPTQYAEIGAVKNGETKRVEIKAINYYGNRYDLLNALYKDPYSIPRSQNGNNRLTPEEMEQFRRNNQKKQVLEYCLADDINQGFEARLIAWSSTPVSPRLIVNGKDARQYEKTFIISRVNLSFRDGNSIEYPFGFVKPEIVSKLNMGNYDEYGRMFYGNGTVEAYYHVEGSIRIERVRIQYTVGDIRRVRQYIWDNQKGDWVEGDYRSLDMQGEMLEKYIDGNNMLKLRFEIDDDNVQLPQIAVKGSVR